MSRLLTFLKTQARNPWLRELLAWCLPALVLGLALRAMLTVALPYAFFHDDAPDFFTTPDNLLNEHRWLLHEKKTFLSPVLFTLPFLVRLPAMIVIPLAQHAMGLVLVVLCGALVRLWCVRWKMWIVPVTLLVAANPAMLWYEHTIMAEAHFVFCTVLLALAGTMYARELSGGRFAFLCAALFFEAGARPEGKLLFGFAALLLVLLHGREWRVQRRRLAIFAGVAGAAFFAAHTSQGGLLLYTSVARFTPAELRCAPGFDPYIAPIRAELQARWEAMPSFPRVRDRKEISRVAKKYLDEQAKARGVKDRGSHEAFCLRLAKETCVRNLAQLPGHTLHKFRYYATVSPAELFDNHMLFEKQREAVTDQTPLIMRNAVALFGRDFASDTAMHEFIDTAYGEVPWFNALSNRWYAVASAARLPDTTYRNPDMPRVPFVYHGLPIYMLLAAAALLAVLLRRDENWRFHLAWGLTLIAFVFVVMLTANVRARFRFFLEPFWFLYLALLLDLASGAVARLSRRG